MSFESEVSELAAQRISDRVARRRADEEELSRAEAAAGEWRESLVNTVRAKALEAVPVFGVAEVEVDSAACRRSTRYKRLGSAWALHLRRDYWKHDGATFSVFLTPDTHWLAGQYRSNKPWHAIARPTGAGLGITTTWQEEVSGLPELGAWTVWRGAESSREVIDAALLIAALLENDEYRGPNENGIYTLTE